jgi:glycosyltransferase involved in cell wall biosynthesis
MPTDLTTHSAGQREWTKPASCGGARDLSVSLLTAGTDRHYVYGLTSSLIARGVVVDLIGSDDLVFSEFQGEPRVNFFNLRGDQRHDAPLIRKITRIFGYYARLLRYAATAKPKIFHILWNNKFQTFDRTLLMLYYKLLGKRVVLTAHNVNAARRDRVDSWFNRFTLKIQYRLTDHVFIHTAKGKSELSEGYGISADRISVIPYGINNAVPCTGLTPADAKRLLGLKKTDKAILFFGHITPYKGLEYLIDAYRNAVAQDGSYRLVIAGRPDPGNSYWDALRRKILPDVESGRVILREEFIPDEDTEIYFKAADVFALPYKHIYQSGVLFLGFSFGLPVLAADVGSLRDEIDGEDVGFVFRPEDSADLARAIEQYFGSDLYAKLEERREAIQRFAEQRHSWDLVGEITRKVYSQYV